jgi:hypothetical protein
LANTLIDPVRNNDAVEAVIRDTYDGTLVMCADNVPYAVPINHAFVGGRFLFHCAVRGRKLDLIRQNPNVCYVIAKYHATPGQPPPDCRCHGPWESVIAYGTARIVHEPVEKAAIFGEFMGWYGQTDFAMSDHARNDTSAIVLDVTSMTVRVELTEGVKDYWLWLPQGV